MQRAINFRLGCLLLAVHVKIRAPNSQCAIPQSLHLRVVRAEVYDLDHTEFSALPFRFEAVALSPFTLGAAVNCFTHHEGTE